MALEDVVILNVDTNTLETPFDDLQSLPNDVVCMGWLTQGSVPWQQFLLGVWPMGLTGWGLSLVALNCFTSILAVPKRSGMFVWTFALKPHSENQLMLTWARNPASLVNFCFQMKPCGVFSCDCFQVSFKELRAFYVLRYDIKLMPSHSLQSLLEFRTHFLSHSPFLLVNFMFLITW